MTCKAKLVLFYLLVFVMMIVWSAFFFLKWYIVAWLFYFAPLFSRMLIHPFPKVYVNIYKSKMVVACLIFFSMMAIFLSVINIIYANAKPFSARLEKINTYGFIFAIAFLIPAIVMSFREEIKYAVKADAETNAEVGVK
jgi:hypothetical protein